MTDTVWIAFNDQDIWPMQHEGDYAEGDNLIQITADGPEGLHMRLVKNESAQSGEAPGGGLSFKQYQVRAFSTAFYPQAGKEGHPHAIAYCSLKLNGEAGEVAETIGKVWREGQDLHSLSEAERIPVLEELGDVLWYISALCTEWGVDLEAIAAYNLEKLAARSRQGPAGWSDARKQQVLGGDSKQGD